MKVEEIFKQIDDKKGSIEFMPTGFRKLDSVLDGGFLRQELVVLGGSTGIGKSYVSGQTLFNIAKLGYKTAYFSLEITNSMIVSRLLGSLSNVRATRIISGDLFENEKTRKEEGEGKLIAYSECMNFYDQMYEFKEIVKTIQDNNFDFIVIDFIQNIVNTGMDEYTRLSYISLELQKLAKKKNTCIMLLSQMSNMNVRQGENPYLEFKGSGSIATVADLAIIVSRPKFDVFPEYMQLWIRKNRRGVTGDKFGVRFTGEGGWLNETELQS